MEFTQEVLEALWREELDFNLEVGRILKEYARGRNYAQLPPYQQHTMDNFLFRVGLRRGYNMRPKE